MSGVRFPLWPPLESITKLSQSARKPSQFEKPAACLYQGTDQTTGKTYVGQTVNEAEIRFLQHRKDQSGPYKNGSTSVNWQIIDVRVDPAELDYKEAFWIGYYDSYSQGFNDTKGNSLKGYQDGQRARFEKL